MFRSFIFNTVAMKIEGGECLSWMRKYRIEKGWELTTYLVGFQCITKMFRSFISNTVFTKIECGECLDEKGIDLIKKIVVGNSLGLSAMHTWSVWNECVHSIVGISFRWSMTKSLTIHERFRDRMSESRTTGITYSLKNTVVFLSVVTFSKE